MLIAGRFRLEEILGEGGMGQVWAATHEVTERRHALKFLSAGLTSPCLRKRFLLEARAACRVDHPNIVTVHDVFELPDGTPVMVMDYLQGETLRDLMDRQGALPLPGAADILLPVVSALGCAHERGIVHRDLKPENIFLVAGRSRAARVRVLDFGVAKLMGNAAPSPAAPITEVGQLVGTPLYMAPEQCSGQADIDHRADIWAVGVMCYELLAGRHPIEGDNLAQVIQTIISRGFGPLEQAVPDLPAEITELVASMLRRDRAERLSDLSQAARVLSEHATIEALSFAAPYSALPNRRKADGLELFDTLAHTPTGDTPAGDPISEPDPGEGQSNFVSRSYGKYCLVSHLARGGMAQVYLAVASQGELGFQKLLVIKEMHRHLADDPEYVAMFLDEARLAARLHHQNIVQTYDVGRHDDTYFMALEYLQGQSLGQVMKRVRASGGHIPPGVALRIISDVLRGLEYAHELANFDGTPLNIVHRDISPGNIFVSYEGATKLVDFGIAKASTQSSATRPGVFKGKLSYSPPEQFADQGAVPQSDLWSLGLVLWEALALHRVFAAQSDAELVQKILEARLPSLRQVLGTTSPYLGELDRLIQKAVRPRIEERYASAREMRAAVDALLERIAREGGECDLLGFLHNLYGDEITRQRKIVAAAVARSPVGAAFTTPARLRQGSIPDLSGSHSTSLSNLNAELQLRGTGAPSASSWYLPASVAFLAFAVLGGSLALAWPRGSREDAPPSAGSLHPAAAPTETVAVVEPSPPAPVEADARAPELPPSASSAAIAPPEPRTAAPANRAAHEPRRVRETEPAAKPSASSIPAPPAVPAELPKPPVRWHKDAPTLPPE
jgi:eukaryotic-like serine/threonine-protein kinase